MKHRGKYGAGLVVAAALGVLVFATSVQALTPEFLIAKKLPAAGLDATFGAKQLGVGTLLIPALSTEINCAKFTVAEGLIGSSTDAKGKLLFEECTALELGGSLAELPGCEIVVNHEGGAQKHHITATGLILPAELKEEVEGSLPPALLIEKIEANVLTKPESGCLLPKTTTIKGELCLKIDNNDTKELLLLSSQLIQESCKPRKTLEGPEILTPVTKKEEEEGKAFLDELKFGVNPAYVDADVDVFLKGAHEGLTLGVSLQ